MKIPKPDKPPYTPVTPVMDPAIGPAKRSIFGVSTTPSGISVGAAGQRKVLIGGAA